MVNYEKDFDLKRSVIAALELGGPGWRGDLSVALVVERKELPRRW